MSKNTNKKPLILALETSGRVGSVAIGVGSRLLAEKTFATPVKHSAELFPAINALLTDFNKTADDIEHIYISIGPGSFTGLRLAVTFAKIMHLANNKIKIVAVDTLDVIAANAADYFQTNPAQKAGTIACILDAKRGRFFIASYKISSLNKPPEKILLDKSRKGYCVLWTPQQFFDNFAASNKPLLLLGEGLVYYRNLFNRASSIEHQASSIEHRESSIRAPTVREGEYIHESRVTGHESRATAYNGIDFLDEKYWYPSASKVYSIGRRLAEKCQFSDPLTLTPRYIQSPDTDNL